MCIGRVDLSLVFRALSNGADGILIAGCRLNECNYTTHGNYSALNKVLLCKRIMAHIGLDPERLRIEFMSSGEGILFAEVVNDFIKKVKVLGPLGQGEGIEVGRLKATLRDMAKRVPYIKMVKKDKLALRPTSPEEYDRFYTDDEVDKLLNEVVSYWIDPGKCQACMICMRKCPVEAIAGGRDLIHIIDQGKCIKCGSCFDSCPPRFAAIRKIISEPVPPPIAEEARSINRKAKGAQFQ
jgi:F420-non-reducing hydrogenase iron-sulfur subunit